MAGPTCSFSNDTQPNKLYHNNGNGTFTEKAVAAGIAFSEDGMARGGWAWMQLTTTVPGWPASLITQFLQPDAFALPQRRKRIICG